MTEELFVRTPFCIIARSVMYLRIHGHVKKVTHSSVYFLAFNVKLELQNSLLDGSKDA